MEFHENMYSHSDYYQHVYGGEQADINQWGPYPPFFHPFFPPFYPPALIIPFPPFRRPFPPFIFR